MFQLIVCIVLILNLVCCHDQGGESIVLDRVPKFGEKITNITIPVGREAIFGCVVDDLGSFKVAWLRVDTQTILTIHTHVITKNHRISVSRSDQRTWYLHIRDVRESDRGLYMCQINTSPMKSQAGYLNVVVSPDILDFPTSTDMVAREGTNVTLQCAANGSPFPNITWRRENGECIPWQKGETASIDGPILHITRVNRLQMGAYLCIASNGVPPSVSKRVMLIVHFPPMVWIQNQLVGAYVGQQITLECHSEAYPKSINYWTRNRGDIIAQGSKYDPKFIDNAYKVHMHLTFRVSSSDFGAYKCVSKNSLGETDGSIKLYEIVNPLKVQRIAITTLENDALEENIVTYTRHTGLIIDTAPVPQEDLQSQLPDSLQNDFLDSKLKSSAYSNFKHQSILGLVFLYHLLLRNFV